MLHSFVIGLGQAFESRHYLGDTKVAWVLASSSRSPVLVPAVLSKHLASVSLPLGTLSMIWPMA